MAAVMAMAMSELTGYFYGIKKHSIDGVLLVLITGISGHNCGRTMDGLWKTVELNCQKEMWKTFGL